MQGRKNGQARAKGRGEDTEGRTKKKVRTKKSNYQRGRKETWQEWQGRKSRLVWKRKQGDTEALPALLWQSALLVTTALVTPLPHPCKWRAC